MTYDNILLVAFGGPTPGCCGHREPCPGEAHCFVEGILGKDPKRAPRVNEVVGHYRRIGGFSPFNELTFAQAEALRKGLAARGIGVPVRVGMRHWRPWIRDVVAEIARAGQSSILAVILAPHQSAVSWDWYQQAVAEGLKALGESPPRVDYLEAWPTHPGYIAALAGRVKEATQGWATDASISWTRPDIHEVIAETGALGTKDVLCVPAGFLSDHVEILYDLDIAARATAKSCGVALTRAPAVGTHPAFIGMLAGLIAGRFPASATA